MYTHNLASNSICGTGHAARCAVTAKQVVLLLCCSPPQCPVRLSAAADTHKQSRHELFLLSMSLCRTHNQLFNRSGTPNEFFQVHLQQCSSAGGHIHVVSTLQTTTTQQAAAAARSGSHICALQKKNQNNPEGKHDHGLCVVCASSATTALSPPKYSTVMMVGGTHHVKCTSAVAACEAGQTHTH